MTKTVSVSAIKDGTVIDHIPQGQAVNIIRMLHLTDNKNKMTVGLNLTGKKTPFKDLIKLEGRKLTEFEMREIAVLAPGSTINLIENYEVKDKVSVELPDSIEGLLVCPNINCISSKEPVKTSFRLLHQKNTIKLTCKYCEKSFAREDIKEYCS